MRTRKLVVVGLVGLVACRSAPAPKTSGPGAFPSPLAKAAASLSPGPLPSTLASVSGPASSPGRTPTATLTAGPPPVFVTRGEASDPTDDQGNAPPYADLLRMSIESDGTYARVTVTMDAAIPNPMASGEEMAVGVDLYRTADEQESEYQLYASGNAQGWVAFLDTPSGFVRYPGAFEVGGERLVFTLPRSSLAGVRDGYARAFMDWDRKGAVLTDSGEDHMPDAARTRY